MKLCSLAFVRGTAAAAATVAFAVLATDAHAERHLLEMSASRVFTTPSRGLYDYKSVVTAVAMSPDGNLLASAGDDHLIGLWDVGTGRLVRKLPSHEGWIRGLSFRPDGEHLASAGDDGRVVIWNVATGQMVRTIANAGEAAFDVAYSPDGSQLAAIGYSEHLRIYDTTNYRLTQTLTAPARDMRALAFSPDGAFVATAGRQGKLRIWTAADGQVVTDVKFGAAHLRAIAFSPDGTQVAVAGDGPQLGIFRVADGHEEQSINIRPGKVLSLTYCGPGRLATGQSDNLVRVWDLATGDELSHLVGHRGSVAALEFLPDTQTLISGSFDTTVRFWNVPSEGAPVTARRGEPTPAN
ncbi:MAG: WD40 repeat domain-containing protein [Pirellulales bacterium]